MRLALCWRQRNRENQRRGKIRMRMLRGGGLATSVAWKFDPYSISRRGWLQKDGMP
ncbi:hypothetical protein IMCC21224_111702 [Puniceibacterium sp. IMCC21224]|nr:hypothetical protein IMCC21224_111702 [Puniceibacterium sp. IMCC21224]